MGVLQTIDTDMCAGITITDSTIALVLAVLSAYKVDTFLTGQAVIIFGASNTQAVITLVWSAVGVIAVTIAFTTSQAVAIDA